MTNRPHPKPHPKSRDEIMAVARELAARFATHAADHDRDGSFPEENYEAVRASGYPSLAIPAALGGWGGTLTDAVMAQEILGSGDGSTALAITMHTQTIGAAASGEKWDAALFQRLATDVTERGALVNSCATEPELGSPSRGGKPQTTARHDPDSGEYVINGIKTFASMSPTLNYFIIPAAIEPDRNKSNSSDQLVGRFLVPRQDAIQIEKEWDSLGMRATGSHNIVLKDARTPADHLIVASPVGIADPDQIWVNFWFTLTVSAVYLGVAAAAQSAALEYARDRVPTALGRPISTLESVQSRIGETEIELTYARNALYYAAEQYDRYPDKRPEQAANVAATKISVINAAIRIVDQCMRAVGGAAMTHALPLERYYRDVRAGLYHPPTEDQTLRQLGRLKLGIKSGE